MLQCNEVMTKRAEFMEEISYISTKMIVWLDKTGSEGRNKRRKWGYHLREMTPDFKFTVQRKVPVFHWPHVCKRC